MKRWSPQAHLQFMTTGRWPEDDPPAPPALRAGLMRISAPHYVAGLVVRNFRVSEAAPIVKYMRGWHPEQVHRYCKSKGWSVEEIPDR